MASPTALYTKDLLEVQWVPRRADWEVADIHCSRMTFLRKNELKNHSHTHEVPGHVPCPNNW